MKPFCGLLDMGRGVFKPRRADAQPFCWRSARALRFRLFNGPKFGTRRNAMDAKSAKRTGMTFSQLFAPNFWALKVRRLRLRLWRNLFPCECVVTRAQFLHFVRLLLGQVGFLRFIIRQVE